MALILEPARAEKNYRGDLWRHLELFILLAWRAVTVRYKQIVIDGISIVLAGS
jgi:lipopolysaccharide transport system permease protein